MLFTCSYLVGAEVSNPRPSPCKSEEDVLVSGFSRAWRHRSACVYLGVLLTQGVTQNRGSARMCRP